MIQQEVEYLDDKDGDREEEEEDDEEGEHRETGADDTDVQTMGSNYLAAAEAIFGDPLQAFPEIARVKQKPAPLSREEKLKMMYEPR